MLDGTFDAITIGTAVHWMNHEIVFEKILAWLSAGATLAIIDSERADNDSPWSQRWVEFLKLWLWRMEVQGKESFTEDFRQPVEHFIACQHSTAIFARAKMGAELAAEFDADLDHALGPLSNNGLLAFKVRSNLTGGSPRRSEREMA